VPIHKKGKRDIKDNYRPISLLCTAYKIYAGILKERIQVQMEVQQLFNDTQNGYRERRSAIDNVFIVTTAIENELRKNKGKLFVFFSDLKSAFDTVNREILYEKMSTLGIKEEYISAIRAIYTETENLVRINDTTSYPFWTDTGLKQGCPLSPLLFSIYLTDLENTLKSGQSGGVVIGKHKVHSLSFADDVVLFAKNNKEMNEAINRFKKYLDRRNLTLSTDKSKIMVFNKGGRISNNKWTLDKKQLEEVKEWTYLGYRFANTNTMKAHVEERARKGEKAIRALWSLCEHRIPDNIYVRIRLFDRIVAGVLLYGSEIWGWEESQAIERIQERYLRWTLGVHASTPGYIIREEWKRDKMRIRTGGRAMSYELKALAVSSNEILLDSIKIIKEGRLNRANGWTSKRLGYLQRCGHNAMLSNNATEAESRITVKLKERDSEEDSKETIERIRSSTYFPLYEIIRTNDVPEYFKIRAQLRTTLARYRCGNESQSWINKECLRCSAPTPSLDHVLLCNNIEKTLLDLLSPDGEGVKELCKIKKH